jgi:hypothetical protein
MLLNDAYKYLPFVQAAAKGKTIQHKSCLSTSGWHDMDPNIEWSFCDHSSCYRIKPSPKLRPWRPEEVPVGALIKWKTDPTNTRYLIVGSQDTIGHIIVSYPNDRSYRQVSLINNAEHSLDHGKTWLPCGVMVEE